MDLTAKRNAFARFTQLKENAFAVNRKYFEREVPPPFSEGGKTLIHEKQVSLRNAKEAFNGTLTRSGPRSGPGTV